MQTFSYVKRVFFRQSSLDVLAGCAITVSQDVEARLNNLAVLAGRSKTFYATEAICKHIDDLKDLSLAERELEAIRARKSEIIPLEAMMKHDDMED